MIRQPFIFYLGLFLLQLAFYFIAPSFYVSSPGDLVIPNFIMWSFGKYFALMAGLYITWALLLAALNQGLLGKALQKISKKSYFIFLMTQLCATLLWITWQHPSTLGSYPGFKNMPLLASYALLTFILLASWIYFNRIISFKASTVFRSFLALVLPIGFLFLLNPSTPLNLPKLVGKQHILLLGLDALDGPTGNAFLKEKLKNTPARLFEKAYTPLPLTHPAWNSVLSGQYPSTHGVRYFFESPLKSKTPDNYLQKILKNHGYLSLHAADQPETSYFRTSDGFDATTYDRKGWEAHMVATLINHFVFPALWLNNPWVEKLGVESFNYAGLFNYESSRFFNQSLGRLNQLSKGPKFLALHSCFLHTPVHLNKSEVHALKDYLWRSPKSFSFKKWPEPGEGYENPKKNWINPYPLRRASLLNFLENLISQLKNKGYLENSHVVLLSDHGERFIKGKELYGGVHGVDLKTQEQTNVLLAVFNKNFKNFQTSHENVSLVDVAPTLISLLNFSSSKLNFDGLPLLASNGDFLPLPERKIKLESMGYLDHQALGIEFPQIAVSTLQANLSYKEDGGVVIGKEYYERIIPQKSKKDF